MFKMLYLVIYVKILSKTAPSAGDLRYCKHLFYNLKRYFFLNKIFCHVEKQKYKK